MIDNRRLISISGVLLGTFIGFFCSPVISLDGKHGTWSTSSFHSDCICHFFIFCAVPSTSYGNIQCGFIPSAVWRFSNTFSVPLGVGKLV